MNYTNAKAIPQQVGSIYTPEVYVGYVSAGHHEPKVEYFYLEAMGATGPRVSIRFSRAEFTNIRDHINDVLGLDAPSDITLKVPEGMSVDVVQQ